MGAVGAAGGGVSRNALQQYCTAGALPVTIREGVTTILRDASLPSLRRVQ
jgi:predicted site-specific integrase-resolvase